MQYTFQKIPSKGNENYSIIAENSTATAVWQLRSLYVLYIRTTNDRKTSFDKPFWKAEYSCAILDKML